MKVVKMLSNFTSAGVCIVALCMVSRLAAANYYVSPTGSDGNNGTSTSTAWQTISKVNSTSFAAGDYLYFEGGKTFAGNVTFTSNDGGNASNRFTVSSYGTGVATINADKSTGIDVSGITGITIQNLKIVGAGIRLIINGSDVNPGQNGNGIKVSGSNNVTIDHVEVTGFQICGIGFGSTNDIRITYVNAHDNGYAGISTRRVGGTSNRVYVGYCTLHNNCGDRNYSDMSGQGVEFGYVKKATIEYCVADSGGWNCSKGSGGGPVAIWCYQSDSITMQYNIAHNNFTKHPAGLTDGGAFDFDDNTSNSVCQYNYSYENDGPFILTCNNSASLAVKNCVIRYNISMNDGQLDGWNVDGLPGNVSFGIRLYASHNSQNIRCYNNLVYTTGGRACIQTGEGGIWTRTQEAHVWNNIFIQKDTKYFADNSPAPIVLNAGNSDFKGNLYWSLDGPDNLRWKLLVNSGHTPPISGVRTTLDEARNVIDPDSKTTPNFEMLGGSTENDIGDTPVGMVADPKLKGDVRNYPKLTDPTQLASLFDYFSLQSSSPCINAGLTLQTQFSENPGTRDFFGTSIPFNTKFEIGAAEYTGATSLVPAFLSAKNSITSKYSSHVQVYSVLGRMVGSYHIANVKALSIPELSRGNYVVVYSDGNATKMEKLTVVK